VEDIAYDNDVMHNEGVGAHSPHCSNVNEVIIDNDDGGSAAEVLVDEHHKVH